MKALDSTYKEISNNKTAIAVLPLGSVEQHGLYLPLGTDFITAQALADRLADKLADKVVMYPPLPYGCAMEHSGFPGTVYIDYKVYYDLLHNIFRSFSESGFKKIFVFSAHGGNDKIAQVIEISWNYNNLTKVFYTYAFDNQVVDFAEKLFGSMEEHAGTAEVSLIYSIDPKYKKTDRKLIKNNNFLPTKSGIFKIYKTVEVSKTGTVGYVPEINIDTEKGKKLLDFMVNNLVEKITKFYGD